MKLLNRTADKVTLELTRQELHLANALIQEGRISHECDSPEGQAGGWDQLDRDKVGGITGGATRSPPGL
jgi:hypothetical protein